MEEFDMDEWADQRNELLALFDAAFYEGIASISEDADLDELIDSIAPVASCINAKNILYQIESWFEDQASYSLESKDANEKIGELSQHIPYGWIGLTINPYIDSVQVAMKTFKTSAENFSDYANKDSGISGLIKGAVEGFLNPVDALRGIATVFDDSLDEEGVKLQKSYDRTYSEFVDAVAIVNHELDNTIVAKWNTTIIHL